MRPRITLCSRCRGIERGWNNRYIAHSLLCRRWLQRSLEGAALIAALMLGFPRPSVSVSSVTETPVRVASLVPMTVRTVPQDVRSMTAFLRSHKVDEANCSRLAESIVASAHKHGLNPRLLAAIMIVESRGNPFAISGQSAIGIMQIHLPTWGDVAVRENVNLLKIEDNVDFGARILKDYIRRYGVSEGIRRYNGFVPGDPSWEKSSEEYLSKVAQLYPIEQTATASHPTE